MRHLWGVVFVVASSSCLDTQLPTAPIVGPGTLRATLVSALPNQQDLSPAKGATVTLVGTTLRATADDDGNVLLTGITARTGRVLFAFDADGDGTAERSRVVTLEAVRAGFGKDVNLGQLVLGRNATLVGTVKRGDRVQLTAGHGGIAVFLPQLPQLTYTGDDGSFSLGGVPEGNVVLSAFAAGYRSEATPIDVGASREERVGLIVLEPAPGSAAVGQLSGRVEQADGTPIPAVQVRAASRGTETVTQTNAEGRFVFETLQTGVYALALSKTGLASLKVDSVLVNAGLNQVGPYVMTEGMSTSGSLDGGPAGPPDAGSAGGGSAGGSAAGGSAAGGSAAGG
ncbi:MAG: carboxypeptidase regulatory-like domain-containing protein, partial [Myxococcales bacterium]|nr:carboxypeptidase regulatory-like domain-containing protein [Myxococcales bacterium]